MVSIDKINVTDTLNDGREKINKAIDSIVNSSGNNVTVGFSGSFESLESLKKTYPDGATGTFLVGESDGTYHTYFYQNKSWKDLGSYQGKEIINDSVTFDSIDKEDFNLLFDPSKTVVYTPKAKRDYWRQATNITASYNRRFFVPIHAKGIVSVSIRGNIVTSINPQISLVKASTNTDSTKTSKYCLVLEKISVSEMNATGYTTFAFSTPVPEDDYLIAINGFQFFWALGANSWYEENAKNQSVYTTTFSATDDRVIDMVVTCDSLTTFKGRTIDDAAIDISKAIMSASNPKRLFISGKELPIGTTGVIFGTDETAQVYLFKKNKDNTFTTLKKLTTTDTAVGNAYRRYMFDYISEQNIFCGAFGNIFHNDGSYSNPLKKGHYETTTFKDGDTLTSSLNLSTATSLHMMPISHYDEKLINFSTVASQSLISTTKKKNKSLAAIIRKMKRGEVVTISLYGDSTYYGHKSGASPLGTRTEEPVSVSLQKYLRAYYLNENITVNNYASNGRKADQDTVDWNVKMKNDNADVIFINFGINDSNVGKTADAFYDQMSILVEGAIATNKAAVIETANQVLTYDRWYQGMGDYTKSFNIKEFVEVSRQIAKDYNVNLLDGYERSLSYINEYFNPTVALPDGMHPSDDMYKYKAVQMMSMFTNTSKSRLKSGQKISILESLFSTSTPEILREPTSTFGFKYNVKDVSVSFGLNKQSDIKIYIKSTTTMKIKVNGLDTSFSSSDGYITIKDVHSNDVFIQITSDEATDIYALEVV